MPEVEYDETEDTQAEGQAPKQLREAYEREKAKREQLDQELAELKAARRQSEVKDFVKEKGLPDKAVSLIGDRDPKEWYEEFGDLFGTAAEEKTEGKQPPPPEETDQLKQFTDTQAGQFQPGSEDEINSKLDTAMQASTSDEFYEMLRQMDAAM